MPATFVLVVCSQCRGTRWRLFAPLCTYHWLCTVEVHTTGYWLLNMCNKCVCCLIRVLVYGRSQLLVPLQLIVCSLVAYMPLAMYSWRTCHWSCAEQASDLSSLDGWPGTLHVQSLSASHVCSSGIRNHGMRERDLLRNNIDGGLFDFQVHRGSTAATVLVLVVRIRFTGISFVSGYQSRQDRIR